MGFFFAAGRLEAGVGAPDGRAARDATPRTETDQPPPPRPTPGGAGAAPRAAATDATKDERRGGQPTGPSLRVVEPGAVPIEHGAEVPLVPNLVVKEPGSAGEFRRWHKVTRRSGRHALRCRNSERGGRLKVGTEDRLEPGARVEVSLRAAGHGWHCPDILDEGVPAMGVPSGRHEAGEAAPRFVPTSAIPAEEVGALAP